MERVLFSWSGGKDSALALYELQKSREYEIAALLTTFSADYDRTTMHGVRRVLLEQQADALGLPLEKVILQKDTTNAEYEDKMRTALERYQAQGVTATVFGDLFLEEVRQYREDNLAKLGMKTILPLWGRDTRELARTFFALGFQAITTCVDSHALDPKFVGRLFDEQFVAELPASVDPCGENGEFHSFAFAGPIFEQRIAFTKGKVVQRENRFYYCDLLPI